MKAIVIREVGGPEVLEFADVAEPVLAGGDLLVRIQAAGVNFIDTYHRSGVYPVHLPFVVGQEAAGEVVAVSPAVTDFAVGDLVAWPMNAGSYAELAVVPAAKAVLVPVGVAADEAAALMLQGLTAHYLTHSTFQLDAGHTMLVHAAAGGVGQLLCQLGRYRGARVIGTVSTEEKAQIAAAAGADEVIRYDTEDVAATVRELTDGRGVDVVYDGVGKDTFEASLASLRPRGLLALFGGASGQVPPFDLQRLSAAGSLFVTRPTLGHHLASPAELQWRAGEMLALLAGGQIQLDISRRYPLAEAALAHRDLEGRRTRGKLLLIP